MAATDLEKLTVQLSADIKRFENNMRRAAAITNRQMGAINRSATQASSRIGNAFTGMSTRVAGALAALGTASGAASLLLQAQKIENALKVTGLAGTELEAVYRTLFASAQANAAPIATLVDLYSKVSLVQNELGISTTELTSFTNNVALALRVAGTDATAASGALLQLSQALGGGTVRAEEFNSILEGAPTIAIAAAAGLKEAGGSVAELRKLVIDGAVSSEAFFRAFEAGSVVLAEKAATSTLTLGQEMTKLENTLIDVAKEMDEASDASGKLGSVIGELGVVIRELGSVFVAVAETDIGQFTGAIWRAYAAVRDLKNFMGGFSGTLSTLNGLNADIIAGRPVGSSIGDAAIQNRIDQAFETEPAAPKTGRLPAAAQAAQTALNPVSIKDFAAPSESSKSGGGGGSAKKRGGSGGESDYQREIDKIKERTAAIIAETDAQKCVCGTIFELETA